MMMSEFRIFITFFLLFFITSTTMSQTVPQSYFTHFCSNTTTFTINSTYQSNLKTLLSTFSSMALQTYEFTGKKGESPDTVYGLFSCRGDFLRTDICVDCVRFATGDVSQRCPVEKQAVILYEKCFLMYSNVSTFPSTLLLSPMTNFVNPGDVADVGRLNDLVTTLMNDVTDKALATNQRLATTEIKDIYGFDFQSLYGLAQCLRELSRTDCSKCLRQVVAQLHTCCGGKKGVRVISPSCYVRYEIYPFYKDPAVAAPEAIVTKSKVAAPEATVTKSKESQSKWVQIVGSMSAVLGLAVLGSLAFIIWRRRTKKSKGIPQLNFGVVNVGNENLFSEEFQDASVEGSQEFPSIQFDVINAATKNFSVANKLGEGGFGPVYKGVLADGKEIAVKRLSRTSSQGLLEFKNEVILIARLQHKNLVRLLGCCLENNEKMLVYEFMPNKSLDVFLFDAKFSMQLDWPKRFSIINGIARGILYLHEDSRLRIIHRDLKASNVLLDGEMNPKISDFGMARIVGGNQSEANTKRIVGTYGYMSPEYAMEGLFSVKSDVFSFGVLLLEIISGKKNNGFYCYERNESLLTFAWKLWSEGRGIELIDPVFVQTCVEFEVLKCIHIGLLCVQKNPVNRPSMLSVNTMLVSETIVLPKPTEPAYFVGRVTTEEALPSTDNIVYSVNEMSISNVKPR